MKTFAILAAALLGCSGPAWAQQYPEAAGFSTCTAGYNKDTVGNTTYYCNGPADVDYTVTIQKMGFKRADGTLYWMTGTKSFNVAAASAGAQVGAYLSGISLPVGIYTEIHAVVNLRQTAQGSGVTVAGIGVACPAGAVTADRGYTAAETCVSRGIAAPYENNVTAAQGCVQGSYNYAAADLTPNLVVSGPATTATINMNFNVSRGLLYTLGTNTPPTTCAVDSIGHLQPTFTVTQ